MPESTKHARYYAIILGRRGGHARSARLTPEQRTRIARNAAVIRWARHRERTATAGPNAAADLPSPGRTA